MSANSNQYGEKVIRILHALIWLSLTGYCLDDYDSIVMSYIIGCKYLDPFFIITLFCRFLGGTQLIWNLPDLFGVNITLVSLIPFSHWKPFIFKVLLQVTMKMAWGQDDDQREGRVSAQVG